MEQILHFHVRSSIKGMLLLWLSVLLCCTANSAYAQGGPKKKASNRAQSTSLPSGYTQVGSTQLYINQTSSSIDVIGAFGGYYYSSTYSNGGYKVAMKVGSNSAVGVDCLNGTTNNGVTFHASVEQQGELARICYTLTNSNEQDVVVSLGTHADVMIGGNDRAPISRRIDTFEQTYGLTMKDGNGAQLCVLFGSGLAGVTAVSDFWFGYYNTNRDASNMVGNYSGGSNYMEENGSYDSGMGWCWKDRTIAAGSTVIFSYLIGVGEVNLEPKSSFEVTPDDAEGWNDLSNIHVLTLEGSYESPAGLDGKIEYAVEDSEEWTALTEMLPSGSTFTGEVRALFDPTKATHVIRFRTVDNVGNTTLLHPIEYADVSFHELTNIEEKTFTGDSLYQTNVTCDLAEGQYVLTGYQNNKNAGTASFRVEGVFPYTIGRKTYTFTINPQPLAGEVVLSENSFVYNGQPFTSEWHFSNEAYATLKADKDYTAAWSNNTLPGTGALTVTGKGNYAGELTANITIDKAPLTASLYSVTMPAEDISYDAQPHAATVTTSEGVGTATITYAPQGTENYTTDAPVNEGAYDVYLTIADGTLYYGKERTKLGSFAIYTFSATEWASLKGLYTQLAAANPTWATKWQSVINSNTGMLNVAQLEGVVIEKGHVIGFDFTGENLEGTFPSMLLTFPAVKVLDVRNNNLSGDIQDVITEVYAYISQYAPTFTSELETLNITGNKIKGNIGLLAASTETVPSLLTRFPLLTTLWASGNCFDNVYPHLPASIVNLDLTNQVIDYEMHIDLSNFDVTALSSQIPTLFVYNHLEQSYNTTPYARLSNYPPTATTADYTDEKPYWGVDAFLLNNELGLTCLAGNTYKGASGDILYVSYPIATTEVAGSYCYTKYTFRKGDANFVNGIDITDLQATINYIFGDYNTYPFNFTAADTYTDARLNVQDVVCTANIIMDAESPANSSILNMNRASTQGVDDVNAYLTVRDGKVILYTAEPIASFDITFEGSPNLMFNLESSGYDVMNKQQNNTSRYLGYTLSDQYIPVGETVIAEYTGAKPVILSAVMADQAAQYVRTSIVGETTSIVYQAGSDANAEYYTLSGIRMEKPAKGMNIVKTVSPDGKVISKVVYIK